MDELDVYLTNMVVTELKRLNTELALVVTDLKAENTQLRARLEMAKRIAADLQRVLDRCAPNVPPNAPSNLKK